MDTFTATYATGRTETVDARNFYEAANMLRQLRASECVTSLVAVRPAREPSLTTLLRDTKQTLCVPAAEYVPAMGEAMLLLDRAIQLSYQTDPDWLASLTLSEGVTKC